MTAQERGLPIPEELTEEGPFAEWWHGFLRGLHRWDDASGAPLRVVDLFSGAGGFGLISLKKAGCAVV